MLFLPFFFSFQILLSPWNLTLLSLTEDKIQVNFKSEQCWCFNPSTVSIHYVLQWSLG